MMIVEDITPKSEDNIEEQENENVSENGSPNNESHSRDGSSRQSEGRERGN